jgi:arginase family enzyme
MPAQSTSTDRTYHVLGVPLRTGSLYPGSENDAQAYRDVGLLDRLHRAGLVATDDGDLPIPSYLPHHTVPPIRSWPGPRIVWDLLGQHIAPILEQPGHIPLLIGCDCSIVVGSAQALMGDAPDDLHVLYVDGDVDDAPPDPTRSLSAAALATWLLTQPSPFWAGPPLKPSQVTVIGASAKPAARSGVRVLSLADVQQADPREVARQVLDALPPTAKLLLHLDVDVIRQHDMPAAYFPHAEGLTWAETRVLLDTILADPRIRIVEVAEYAALRDADQACASRFADLLAEALKP